MRNIVLLMNRKSVAEGIMNSHKDRQGFDLIYEPNYKNANIIIGNHKAKAALIEVAESGPYDLEYCLDLCNELKKNTPKCKLIVMCSEQDERSVKQVIYAKGKDEIDDFVFYDVTIDYLTSKLMSI